MATSGLTFPRPIFAALAPSPFLSAHLSASDKQPLRANTRTPIQSRKPLIHTNSLTHCQGSSVVQLGNTHVVCGIRAEILKGEDIPVKELEASDDDREEIETLRLLVPNIEVNTGSAPQFLPGQAPGSFAQTLVSRIKELLLSTRIVQASDLRILYTPPPVPTGEGDEFEEQDTVVRAYWVLYIDTFFLSLDGSAFSAACLAILSALRKTVIPHAFWDPDLETVLCDDLRQNARTLSLRGCPIVSEFSVFETEKGGEGEDEKKSWVLSDPDAFEEGLCREGVTIVIDSDGSTGKKVIKRMEKSGGVVVGKEEMRGLIKRAEARWDKCVQALKNEQ